jgi:hypothetical protein
VVEAVVQSLQEAVRAEQKAAVVAVPEGHCLLAVMEEGGENMPSEVVEAQQNVPMGFLVPAEAEALVLGLVVEEGWRRPGFLWMEAGHQTWELVLGILQLAALVAEEEEGDLDLQGYLMLLAL